MTITISNISRTNLTARTDRIGTNLYAREKAQMKAFEKDFINFKNTKNPEKKLYYLRSVTAFVSSVNFDQLDLSNQEKIRALLRDYLIHDFRRLKLDITDAANVEQYMLRFPKEQIPHMFYLYSEGFITNNDNNYTYNLDNIVKTKNGDCTDIALAAYNLFKKAGIEARVVKAYISGSTLVTDRKEPVDVHVICVYKTGKGWSFIDHQQVIETAYQSPFELICRHSSFQKYFIRARFVNEEKWNKIIEEVKEPEDGPVDKRGIFNDANFFYVKDRDCKVCKELQNK